MLDFSFSNLIISLPGLLSAMVLYSYGQAKVADNLGDMTPRYCGRLTLNPLVHIDLWGFLCMLFFHIGWAKPTPINPYNFKNPRRGELEVSLAGPLANIMFALMVYLCAHVMTYYNVLSDQLFAIFMPMVQYNLVFAFFNLLPIPPLTGARIVAMLLPAPIQEKINQINLNPYSYLLMMACMALGIYGFLLRPLMEITLSLFYLCSVFFIKLLMLLNL